MKLTPNRIRLTKLDVNDIGNDDYVLWIGEMLFKFNLCLQTKPNFWQKIVISCNYFNFDSGNTIDKVIVLLMADVCLPPECD